MEILVITISGHAYQVPATMTPLQLQGLIGQLATLVKVSSEYNFDTKEYLYDLDGYAEVYLTKRTLTAGAQRICHETWEAKQAREQEAKQAA